MKKIACIKLNLIGGKANFTAVNYLGQFNININSFCKKYNDITKDFKSLLVPIKLIIFNDKSINLKLKTPSIYYFISKYSCNKSINKKVLIKLILLKKLELFPISTKKILSIIKGILKSANIIYS